MSGVSHPKVFCIPSSLLRRLLPLVGCPCLVFSMWYWCKFGSPLLYRLKASFATYSSTNYMFCTDSGLLTLPERPASNQMATVSPSITQFSYYQQIEVTSGLFGCCFGAMSSSALLGTPHNLVITECSKLHKLPNHLLVTGDLFLSKCSSLRELPEDLKAQRAVVCSSCSQLKHLPKDMHVVGRLDLSNCTALERLPDGLRVSNGRNTEGRHLSRGDLLCAGCTRIAYLPTGLKVAGKWHL